MTAPTLIDTFARNALEALVPDPAAPGAIGPAGEAPEGAEMVAVIGFSGDVVRGVVGLTAAPPVIAYLHPEVDKDALEPNQLADWSGELANRFLGRFKIEMMRFGVQLWVATPVVLNGISVRIASAPEKIRHFTRATPAGPLDVWLDVVFDEGAALIPNPGATIHEAGELMLFSESQGGCP